MAAKIRLETFRDDQIVVALADLAVVARELDTLHVRMQEPDPHPKLGLARLPLDGGSIAAAVGELRRDHDIAGKLTADSSAREARTGEPPAPLDELLKGLRLRFARDYDNWLPTFGKNRTISKIAGSPHVDGGGVGPAQLTSTPLDPRTAPPQQRSVRVGLLDTRILSHEWLAGGYLARPDELVQPQQLHPYLSTQAHATSVASRILDRAPVAEVHLRRVLDKDAAADSWEVATTMAEVAEAGFDVVNLSFGEYFTDDGQPPLVIGTAVQLLSAHSVIVAAAGNHGNVASRPAGTVPPGLTEKSPSYPAALPGVLAVGALDADGKPAPFSPKDAPWIRLMAPGVNLTVAYLSGDVLVAAEDGTFDNAQQLRFAGWAECSGTSYAAGMVTGEIALRMARSGITAWEAADQLLHPDPDQPPSVIRPAGPGY
jgi:membrane-anchored mycosin MYCP